MEAELSQSECAIPNLSKLIESQRALLAARQREQLAKDAEQRKKASLRVRNGSKGKTAALVAKRFKVSTRLVEMAQMVLRYGDPAIVEWVEFGEITIYQADKIVSLQRQVPSALRLIRDWLALRARAFDLDCDPDALLEELMAAARPKHSVQELQYSRNRDPRGYLMPGNRPDAKPAGRSSPNGIYGCWRPCAKV
jgi:hypothetical protein